jgi:hypothetical protein
VWGPVTSTPAFPAEPDPDQDPDTSNNIGVDPGYQYTPPVPPVGGYRPPHPSGVAILWIGSPYGAADFPFKVVKKWDRKDGAGGWQQADKRFEFAVRDDRTGVRIDEWSCGVRVGVAVQSQVEGAISTYDAASITADVANIAVPLVSNSRASWTGISGLFCSQLTTTMRAVFNRNPYKGYGARVSKWGP